MTEYKLKFQEITGANCTGTSGTANRTFTLRHKNAIEAQMEIVVDEVAWQQGVNYTFDTDNNMITFVSTVWNDQIISINYFITI